MMEHFNLTMEQLHHKIHKGDPCTPYGGMAILLGQPNGGNNFSQIT